MQFHEHETIYDYERHSLPRNMGREEYHEREITLVVRAAKFASGHDLACVRARCNILLAESVWYDRSRPYYKVFPAIGSALTRLPLDLPLKRYDLQNRVVLVRFPKMDSSPQGIRTILIYCRDGLLTLSPHWISDGIPVSHTSVAFSAADSDSIENILSRYAETTVEGYNNVRIYEPFVAACKIAISVLLLANDPSIIEPEVLAADRDKFAATGDMKYVEKAKRRGVVGWTIGREFETCPHWRRPHLAMRHTGKGRSVPRIVPIKGTIVHRSKLAKVPTGHFSEDGVEVE